MKAGASDFLPKPIMASQLLQQLQKHLGLQWIYKGKEQQKSTDSQKATASPPADDSDTMALPPLPEITYLDSLVRRGSLKRVQKHVEALQRQDPDLAVFTQKVVKFCNNFQEQALLAFLEACQNGRKTPLKPLQ